MTTASSFLRSRSASAEATAFVKSRLAGGGVDLVHCEGFYMHGLTEATSVPVFVMEQNIEYHVWPNEADRIRAEELEVWRRATYCGALTEEDAALMRCAIGPQRVLISFNGSDHSTTFETDHYPLPAEFPRGNPVVLCPGNFAYPPTYEAGVAMCTTIGPAILDSVPDGRVILVGNESERLAPLAEHPSIEIHGRVSSLEPYYAAASVVACPLSLGGGIKIKLLEALVRGCAIVTTDVGRQGLEDAPLVIANGSQTFAAQVVRLLLDLDARTVLSQRALVFGALLPKWDAAAEQLHECWMRTVRARRASVTIAHQ